MKKINKILVLTNSKTMSGEVVLVKKEEVPPIGIPPTTVDRAVRAREKKPLTERQKANLEKLIALNKQKARERKGILDKVPETIPEGYVALPVAPKRKYTRKPKEVPTTPMAPPHSEEDSDSDEEPSGLLAHPKSAVPRNLPNLKLTRQNAYSEDDEPKPKNPSGRAQAKKPACKPKNPSGRAQAKKPVRKPRGYTTEETSDWSSEEESDSEDDEKVQKYVFKAQKRIAEAKAIEEQMNRLKNPYASKGLSIF